MTSLIDLPGSPLRTLGVYRPSPLLNRTASPSRSPLPRRPWLVPTLVGIVAFLISELGNWIPSLWYDETATVSSATRNWGQLANEIQHVDAVHAVYYGLMHLVFETVGYSPFTLRLPSALAVGLTAALLVVLVRTFDRPHAAVVSGVVYGLLPRVTWAGGEGRSYAISALLAVILSLVLLRAIRSTHRRWWVVYAGVAVIAMATFVYLGLVILSQLVVIAALALRQGRVGRPAAVGWLLAVGAAGVLVSPLVLLLHSQTAQVDWIPPLGVDTVRQVFATQWFRGTPAFEYLGWALLAVGTFALLRRLRGLSLGLVALPGLVVPTLVLLGVSLGSEPLYSPRYLTMSAPFVAIVIGVGIVTLAELAGRRMLRRTASVAAILLIAALTIPHIAAVQRAPNAKQNSTWSEVADLVAHERAADGPHSHAAIIYGPVRHHLTATARLIEYAYPAAFVGTTDVTLRHPAGTLGRLWETHAHIQDSLSRLRGADVTYLITSTKQDWRPSITATLHDVGWRAAGEWRRGSVAVLRYVRG